MITEMANKVDDINSGAGVVSSDKRCQKNENVKSPRRVRFCTMDENNEETAGESVGSADTAQEVSIVVYHDTEPMTEEELCSYFVQSHDMTRFNQDMQDAIRKYVDYRLGKCSFDPDSCTIRGLEEIIDHMKCNSKNGKRKDSRADIKAQHIKEVLDEVCRQQQQQMTAGKKNNNNNIIAQQPLQLDADQVRQISLRLSEAHACRAAVIAARDAEEVGRIHAVSSSSSSSSDCSSYPTFSNQLCTINEENCCQAPPRLPKIPAKKPTSARSGTTTSTNTTTCSSSCKSNCLKEKNKNGACGGLGGGRWFLSFRKKTST